MNTELARAVFGCGIDDLRLLDDAECDMYAVIGRMREESMELTMNNIIRQVFEEGRYILTKAREEKIASLPAEPLTEADFELRGNLERLNPEQDFSFWINLQDTNFRGKSELQELYEEKMRRYWKRTCIIFGTSKRRRLVPWNWKRWMRQ